MSAFLKQRKLLTTVNNLVTRGTSTRLCTTRHKGIVSITQRSVDPEAQFVKSDPIEVNMTGFVCIAPKYINNKFLAVRVASSFNSHADATVLRTTFFMDVKVFKPFTECPELHIGDRVKVYGKLAVNKSTQNESDERFLAILANDISLLSRKGGANDQSRDEDVSL